TSASFVVRVVDTSGPVISAVPANIQTEATSAPGKTVVYSNPNATDLVDGVVPVDCMLSSGSIFPIGITTVTCNTADSRGNGSSASFTVTILTTDLRITKTA